jgi:hypothetical protein
MCDQCLAETIMFNNEEKVLPDFYLVQATKDGGSLQANDYGLVRCNDPSFVFSVEPELNPDPNDTFENDKEFERWIDKTTQFENQLMESASGMKDVALLVAGCYQMGYTDSDGSLEQWLFNYLAQFLKGNNGISS